MIDVKTAVNAAVQYARELYGASDDFAPLLEEVEPSSDDRYWFVTLSLPVPLSGIAALAMREPERRYKIFKVDAETGAVHSMKIRSVA